VTPWPARAVRPTRRFTTPSHIQFTYRHSGLTVGSDLQLPELDQAVAGKDGSGDARIVLGVPVGEAAGRAYEVQADRCRFSAPGVGVYTVSGGTEIEVRCMPSADPWAIRMLLLGTAWAALLEQRGAFALHASVVCHSGEAAAFCGPRGAGKSSLVARLVQDGHTLVCDDLCRLEVPVEGPPLVWPAVPRLRLTPETATALGHELVGDVPARPDGKLSIPCGGDDARGPIRLSKLYVLSWGAPGARRLSGLEAVRRLWQAGTYRPQLFQAPDSQQRHWLRCLELARRIPMWELSRERDWRNIEVLPELASSVAT